MKDAIPRQLQTALEAAFKKQETVVLAIDGPSASGKTTLADRIADQLAAEVVAMDDFFLPGELRTKERLESPGGNVHIERFLAEAAPYLRGGKANEGRTYRTFDCSIMAYGENRPLPRSPLVVVEGTYSLHPQLRQFYDIKVFLSLDPQEQRRRILLREGPEKSQLFFQRWIPLENRYMEAMKPKEAADLIL